MFTRHLRGSCLCGLATYEARTLSNTQLSATARAADCFTLLRRSQSYVHVTLGSLIDEPAIWPSAHIFTGSKAGWDQICDGLPQFEKLPPARLRQQPC
jgi:hypothetical protein